MSFFIELFTHGTARQEFFIWANIILFIMFLRWNTKLQKHIKELEDELKP